MIEKAAVAYGEFLTAVGFDYTADRQTVDTPRRVAKAWLKDLIVGSITDEPNITVFPNDDGYNGLVIQSGIPIVLNSLNTVEDYEGDFDTRRTVNSVFDFTVKTYVYGPIKESSTVLIEDANIRLYDGQNTVAESIKIFDVGYTGDSSTLSGITYYENP